MMTKMTPSHVDGQFGARLLRRGPESAHVIRFLLGMVLAAGLLLVSVSPVQATNHNTQLDEVMAGANGVSSFGVVAPANWP